MQLTIDNLDGLGPLNYSGRICSEGPPRLERTLNAPSRCTWMLDLNGSTLGSPARRARVSLTTDEGTLLFTGYVVTEPELMFAGESTVGPAYRALVTALSDEWLLDKQSVPLVGAGLAQQCGQLLQTLTARVDASRFVTMGAIDTRSVGVFDPKQTQSWSKNAGSLADSAYSAYRVLNGVVSLQTAGAVTHAFSEGDGTLQMAALRVAQPRELANNVTLSGEREPAAYVTEIFQGDGTTSVFKLSVAPFHGSGSTTVLLDSFDQGAFDPRTWVATDPGSHLGFSGAGLQMTGGNGSDGQTTLVALDSLEIGGSLVIEAGSVQMVAASDGVLCGVYSGPVNRVGCMVGFNVRQSGGSTVVTPLVSGAEVGTTYTMQNGHRYTLRIRLHCPEMQRVLQTYYAMVDGVVQTFGGGLVDASLQLVFELQDLGVAANTPATVLYDGSLQDSTATCTFAVVNSVQLVGSMGYCRIRQTGSAWVTSKPNNGVKATRLIGVAGEGVDCTMTTAGAITVLAGRIPGAGELVTVTYRRSQRSIARMENAVSVAAEAEGGIPGSARWLGKVLQPVARSSLDCTSAVEAVLSFSANRNAAMAGSYVAVNPADVWPGDVLILTTQGWTAYVVSRKVTVVATTSFPELLEYRVDFANDWAEGLGLKLSEAVAMDVLLPQTATSGPRAVLQNLQGMQVVSATSLVLQIDAGVVPPTGGGFEVRRRDGYFGPGVDQDLVLRSPVRSFAIAREGQVEHYYIRMYDASAPPVYSRFSSAIFTNIPVS